ncbi:MAG: ECF-type sigma factor [Planctomycetales bacterium]
MEQVTAILRSLESGNKMAAAELLPLVYAELRRLALAKLSQEPSGQTLQATALVHEAYLRLVDTGRQQYWDGRGHFFAAAAEAMRRILIENARRKLRVKHGGEMTRLVLTDALGEVSDNAERLIELDAALTKLEGEDSTAAQVVKLHFYSGQPLEEVAQMLGMSRATAYRQWSYARSWLRCALTDGP